MERAFGNELTDGIKISLSAKDVLKLINALNKAGVSEFKYKDLHITLGGNYTTQEPAITAGILPTAGQPESKEVDLGELMLSDPLAYEEALNARAEREA